MDWFPDPKGYDANDCTQRLVSHSVFGKVAVSSQYSSTEEMLERAVRTMYLFPFGIPAK